MRCVGKKRNTVLIIYQDYFYMQAVQGLIAACMTEVAHHVKILQTTVASSTYCYLHFFGCLSHKIVESIRAHRTTTPPTHQRKPCSYSVDPM
jgi:hypothetical protein